MTETEYHQMLLLETNRFSSPTINEKLFYNYDACHLVGLISCQQKNSSLQRAFSETDEDMAEPVSMQAFLGYAHLEGMLG